MQALEPGSDMTQILELSGRKFKITVINMLKDSNGKCRHYARQLGSVSKEMKTLTKDQKKVLEIRIPLIGSSVE